MDQLLDALHSALLSGHSEYEGRHVARDLFDRRALMSEGSVNAQPMPEPMRAVMADALNLAAEGPAASVAATLGALIPQLGWRQSASADSVFADGHAGAILIGKGGILAEGGMTLGLSLAAPGVAYPEHDHPPEELYLLLTPAGFRHGVTGWQNLGAGATFYNTPGIRHAMRAGDTPLLALWIFGLAHATDRHDG